MKKRTTNSCVFFRDRLVIGQICAALHNRDWCRARVIEVGENRVRVQLIDW